MTRILVTGTGAVIGYGILRSLRAGLAGVQAPGGGPPELHLIAADVHADAVGRHWADRFAQAPLTADPGYGAWLGDLIAAERVDLIIPGIEQDVDWLAGVAGAPPPVLPGGVRLALNNPDLIRLAGDKWAMARALADRDLPGQIESRVAGDFDTLAGALGLPFLMKPRRGYAGKGIVRVAAPRDFAPMAARLGAEYMAQPIVGTDDAEYTVSVFCDGGGAVRAGLALRRRLAPDGSTAKAAVADMAPFRAAIDRLADAFKPQGPTNFQFRLTEDGPKLLEINPRISSATSLRAAFGMNEAWMCVRHYLWGETIGQPTIRPGRAERFIEDFVRYDDTA